jgi:hypothetical protein
MTISPVSSIPNFPPTVQAMAHAKSTGPSESEAADNPSTTNNLLANLLLESSGNQRVWPEDTLLNVLA